MKTCLSNSHESSPKLVPIRALLIFAVILGACSRTPVADQEPVSELSSSKIDWYEGDVESAFAYAESAGKPLFLYWGAEWCPPCHYLKNKIFTRQGFVTRMQDFVPVYLDGDTARAQILAETLEVKGYPTVIIFNAMGQEVMRMPSTVPVDQYEAVLDAAVSSMKPVKTVLTEVMAAGPESASPADLNLLAFYSWGQDSRVDLSTEDQVSAFRRLYHETPMDLEVERSRFLGLYLAALARQAHQSESTDPPLTAEEGAAAQEAILEVLADPTLRNANLLWVDYYADSIIDLLQPDDTPDRHVLLGAWYRAANAMEEDDALSVDDRLSATVLKIGLVKMSAHPDADDVQIPASLQHHVRSRTAWALETVTEESELQTVVNTLAYMLEDAGLSDEAESMLLSKMHDTAAPYYFMSWLAGLKADAGDTEAALEWYRKAYDSSEGRYSRFRWGSSYLRQLMELSPTSVERIEADSIEVLSELLTFDDAFAGGNHARLDSLQSAYWGWNGDESHDEVLAGIRDHVHASCARYPAAGDDSQRQRCESFMVPEEIQGKAAM